jgi:hypothetical protein
LIALLIAAALPLSGQANDNPLYTMPVSELKAKIEQGPPLLFYLLATRLLKEGTRDDAAFYYYLARARYWYYQAVKKDAVSFDEKTTTDAMATVAGQAINPAIAGSVKKWKAVVDQVIAYVKVNDYQFCSRTLSETEYQNAIQKLQTLSDYIRDNADTIRKTREQNGLANEPD